MIVIDGRSGEGGGQILRTALGLSLLTGKPFRMLNVRAGRKKPGLLRQHLTALQAAARVGGAEVTGDQLGSVELSFRPGAVTPGEYAFAVGTAGSATLVLQTVLPALLGAGGPSELTLEGGTHNPNAPPFDFLHGAFFPIIAAMGGEVSAELDRHGFYPAGGGRFRVKIGGGARLGRLELKERGAVVRTSATVLLSCLPFEVAERELAVLGAKLGWGRESLRPRMIKGGTAPGNAILAVVESERVTEVFAAFGERGKRSERVAEDLAEEVRTYLADEVPVGPHLADQLLLPMAIGQGGVFHTGAPTQHTLTQLASIGAFLDVPTACEKVGERRWEIRIGGG